MRSQKHTFGMHSTSSQFFFVETVCESHGYSVFKLLFKPETISYTMI